MEENENKGIESHVTIKSKDGEKAEISNLPASVLQALYHEITGKTESLTKEFQKSYQISPRDISSLYHRVIQILEQFECTKPTTNIVVRYQGGNIQRISSIEKFTQLGNAITEPTLGVEVSIDFLIRVPSVGKLHQYKLVIVATSHLENSPSNSNDDEFSSDDDQQIGLRFGKKPIFFKVDYVDYVVARNFVSMIEDWEKSLAKISVPRLPKWYRKYEYQLDQVASTLFLFSAAVLCYGLHRKYFEGEFSIAGAVLLVGATFSIAQLMKIAFESMTLKTAMYGKFLFFRFTSGDEMMIEKFDEYKEKKIWRPLATITATGVTTILNVVAGLFLSFLTK